MDASGLLLPVASSSVETFFLVVGGSLVAVALGTAFVGMRRDDFPSAGGLRGLLGLIALLVLATGAGAVLSARDEQKIRRAENEQAAKQTDAETIAKQQQEAPLTVGGAAQPGTASGEASSPKQNAADGRALFTGAGCGDCHTLADAGTSGQIGPVLDEVLPGQDPEAIRTSIVDPGAATAEGFPEGVMPSTYAEQLTGVEIDPLVAYLGEVSGKS